MARIASTVRTERLLLRPHTEADAPRLLDIHSRLEVIRWLGNPPFVPMPDLAAALAMVRRRREQEERDPFACSRAVEHLPTGVVVGAVLVAPMTRIDAGAVGEHELGWHLHPDSVGHGYATEAAAAFVDAAFAAGLPHLFCGMYPDNASSVKVAQRLGLSDLGMVDDPWYGGRSRLFETDPTRWRAPGERR